MNEKIKSWLKYVGLILIILFSISVLITGFFNLVLLESLRIIFGSFYILFLPGFILSFVFFSSSIDWIERIALSFGLSISIVPLTVFYLNIIGIKINFLNSILSILGIIIISSVILLISNSKKYKKEKNPV
jgi:uncharacterized membrane protein